MAYQRIDRISEQVRREVDAILRDELHDPRLAGATISVTQAEVTRDLRFVKVHVSVLEDDRRDDVLKALKSASGFVRRELGRRMIIRSAPEPLFVADTNIAYGIHIAAVLKDVLPQEGADSADSADTDSAEADSADAATSESPTTVAAPPESPTPSEAKPDEA